MASEGGVARCWYSSNSSHFASSRTHTHEHTYRRIRPFCYPFVNKIPTRAKMKLKKLRFAPKRSTSFSDNGQQHPRTSSSSSNANNKESKDYKSTVILKHSFSTYNDFAAEAVEKGDTTTTCWKPTSSHTHTQTHLVLPPAFQKQTNCEFWVLNSLLIIAVICSFACCLKPACWCCYSSTEFSLCFVVCVCVHMSFFVFLFFGFNSSSCICVLKCVNANISI